MLHHDYAHVDPDECAEAMQANGPLLAVEISPPQPLVDFLTKNNKPIPPTITGHGLIDTGATVTTLHEAFIKQLGVKTVGSQNMTTPSGGVEVHNTYPVRLKVPSHGVDVELPEIITADLAKFLTPSGQPIIGLIGRDFLASCILIYNGELGMYTLAT